MPMTETRGGGTINGSSFTKTQTNKLTAVYDGGNESTTPQYLQSGRTAMVHINWTSGTFTIEMSPVGSNSYKPVYFNGTATIGASASVEVEAPANSLVRVTGATAVGTVTIVKG